MRYGMMIGYPKETLSTFFFEFDPLPMIRRLRDEPEVQKENEKTD